MNKEKYCGEVYLELTFWSNVCCSFLSNNLSSWCLPFQEPPPEKKIAQQPQKTNKQYGGPGSFVPTGEVASPSLTTGHGRQPSRVPSLSNPYEHTRQDSVTASLRVSGSLPKLDLYVPPYEPTSSIDRAANDFGELTLSDPHQRESFHVSAAVDPLNFGPKLNISMKASARWILSTAIVSGRLFHFTYSSSAWIRSNCILGCGIDISV